MIFERLSILAVLILVGTSVFLLISRDWRSSIIALSVQYLAVFWLVALNWPIGLSTVKLVAGWMAGAVLSASQPAEDFMDADAEVPTAPLFRLLAAALVLVLAFSVAPLLLKHFPAPENVLSGGLVLVGMGLLHLGLTSRPTRVVVGLLTVLSGFEVLYAAVESSVLVAGLQVVVTLGLAFVGAYLVAAPSMEDSE